MQSLRARVVAECDCAPRRSVDMETAAIPAEPPSLVITVSAALAFLKHRGENTPSLERFDLLVMGFSVSIVAPQGRKHLSADALFRLVQSGFASRQIPVLARPRWP